MIARYFHHSFDTISLCAGVFASGLSIYAFRDKSIMPHEKSQENNVVAYQEAI
jgi:hypothetical protein